MAEIIQLDSYNDKGGELTVLEKKLPFDIKRIFFVTNQQKGQIRARHANRVLKEGLICLAGSCDILLDDGNKRETIVLNNKEECLLIGNMTWIETSNYTEDCILLVLASEYYDEKDHIHDYTAFRKEAQSRP